MKNTLVYFFILFSFWSLAQPPSHFHTKLGGNGIDIGYGVLQTLEGNYIITGSTTFYGAGNSDVVLTKIDSMGVTLWSKTLGGFNNDVAKAIIQLPDSGFIITGFTNSYGNGGYDALIIRTDKLGNQLWLKTYGGLDWDFAYDIIKSADGNFIICGKTSSEGKGKYDAFAIKYDINGMLIWKKLFGGVENDEFKGAYTKNGNEIFLAGSTESYGEINGDMILFKLNTNGDSLMRIIYGGPEKDFANDITLDKLNDIYLAGGSESFTNGKLDALLVKFSPTGNYINKTNDGTATRDEEFFKIVPSQSNFGDIVVIFAKDENQGTAVDFTTFALGADLFFVTGGNNGSFGYLDDEEPFDMCPTRDKGYAQVGYTKSLNALDKDILFVKRDSMIRYGNQVVGLKKERSLTEKNFSIYPNPVQQNGDFSINFSDIYLLSIKVSVLDMIGNQVKEININTKDINNKVNIQELPQGVYLLKVQSPEHCFYYKISKL
ncbi:MAG: T9SS type A sorting domain-containing protein [Sphingobacteriaceae bacterium]|nr:T9SS type A sorting domain-containing protein [Sphingobacteriaceae bacterium]